MDKVEEANRIFILYLFRSVAPYALFSAGPLTGMCIDTHSDNCLGNALDLGSSILRSLGRAGEVTNCVWLYIYYVSIIKEKYCLF